MSSNTNRSSVCRAICWVLGIALGGYTSYALITDYQFDKIQSGAFGLVVALLVGVALGRMVCGRKAKEPRRRNGDIETQSEQEANAIMDKATVKLAATQAAAATGIAKNIPKPTRVKVKTKDTDTDESADAEVPEDTPVETGTSMATDEPVTADLNAEADEVTDEVEAAPEPAKFEMPNMDKLEESLMAKVADATPDLSENIPEIDLDDLADKVNEAKDILEDDAQADDEEADDDEDIIAASDDADNDDTDITRIAKDLMAESASQSEGADPVIAPPQDAPPQIKPMEPTGLDGPENGEPDALEEIDGVDEEQVAALNQAGIYHFAQFTTMNRRELAWLDENIPGGGDDAAGAWRKQAIQLSRKEG